MRPRALISTAAAVLVAAALGALALRPAAGPLPARLPALTLPTTGGTPLALEALRGRPVLLTFWSVTCRVCLSEVPALRRLHRDPGTAQLALVSVAMPGDPPNVVLAMARRLGMSWPVAMDIDGAAARAFGGVAGTPTSFLIDATGAVVGRHVGAWDEAARRQAVAALLRPGQRG